MNLNPASFNPEPQPSRPNRPGTALCVLAVLGAAVIAAGAAVELLNPSPHIATYICWTGFALFVPYAVRRRSLLVWTFFAMLAGAWLGVDAPHFAAGIRVFADLFLRLVRMIVAPLIFGGIVTGIASHGELRSVGRVALKAIVFFEVVTTFGLLIGAVAANLSQAGAGITLPPQTQAEAANQAAHAQTWQQMLLEIFPENIAQAVAQNQVLQVAVFALLFGVALAMLPPERRAPLVTVLQSFTETMFRLTRFIMYLAPLAAGAALAYAVGSMGVASLLPLLKLLVMFYLALAVFTLFVLVPSLLIARVSLRGFIAAVAEPAAIGFATTTSEAALPLAMERMEAFGVPRWIVSFVIPTGYSFNMTGSSVYVSMAALFAAQAAGMHLTIGEQAIMLFTLMLTTKGMAGVPRAIMVILLGVTSALHIPTAAVLMLLGVDTLLDMGRASMNVIGNCAASAVVAQWEGELKSVGAAPQP
jgi:proton glutamate symport protein